MGQKKGRQMQLLTVPWLELMTGESKVGEKVNSLGSLTVTKMEQRKAFPLVLLTASRMESRTE